ncbi:hypothetical protein [Spiroplasma sp. SV19]|uniref:hypothetical protein n=1 Tax=Spiroplasma sp. SV19 TaxID=2570468 RepID=UPI0024B80AAB|nr:hypothetical protein [Spiroplasma sp. SV19]WHQ36374.1 hypothetical protein E7Y35_00220 [Spiroplasma sp. SV19]
MGIWKTAANANSPDRKYHNNFDEVHRFCEGHYTFDVFEAVEPLFQKIVTLSLLTMREKLRLEHLKPELVLHDKVTGQSYLCNEYVPNQVYSLKTKLDSDTYWTIFRFEKIKPNRTRITYLQRVQKDQTIGGAVRFLGRRTFLKNIRKKGAQIALYLSQQK